MFQDHQRGEPYVGVEVIRHDGNDEERKQQIGRKGREKLGQRLNTLRQLRDSTRS